MVSSENTLLEYGKMKKRNEHRVTYLRFVLDKPAAHRDS